MKEEAAAVLGGGGGGGDGGDGGVREIFGGAATSNYLQKLNSPCKKKLKLLTILLRSLFSWPLLVLRN